MGAEAKLHLMVDNLWMEFPCRIAHLKVLPVGCRLGLTARFDNPETETAFLQLLQPIVLGSAMRPVLPEEVRQDDPTMHLQVFSGTPGTELSVWRQYDLSGELSHFLWRMDDYIVQGDAKVGVMQLSTREEAGRPAAGKRKKPTGRLRGAIDGEIRQLFRCTMLNLPKDVPGEIRSFLQWFVD